MINCAECKYFRYDQDAIVKRVCHRYPQIEPISHHGHWCGEFKSATVAKRTQTKGKRLVDYIREDKEWSGEFNISDFMPDGFLAVGYDAGASDKVWDIWGEFIDYFSSADAKNPVKKDWLAAWRNWIRRSKG